MNERKQNLIKIAGAIRLGCICGVIATFYEWVTTPNPMPRLMEENVFPLLLIFVVCYVIDAIVYCSSEPD